MSKDMEKKAKQAEALSAISAHFGAGGIPLSDRDILAVQSVFERARRRKNDADRESGRRRKPITISEVGGMAARW